MLTEKLSEYLKNNYTNSSKCISARKLGLKFGVSDKEIRDAVNELRQNGVPICSCNHGYYFSEFPIDILKTINSVSGRIAKMQTAINGLKLKAYRNIDI